MARCSSPGLLPRKYWRTKHPLDIRTGRIAASLRLWSVPDSFEYILTYLQKEILDYTRVPTTCSFEPPNKVRVSPNPATMMGKKVVLKLKVAHSDFQEFHPGLLETIKKLALCDVKLDILGMRRIFNNINTSMSDIELSLGTYEEAETKRDDLLEKIRASMHLSANRRKIFVDNA